ncbi:MAG TPA: NUDIX hydrolase [Usitatibacter sp.]|nr:NUDIX hydrolase [Usitatibacter sp.]
MAAKPPETGADFTETEASTRLVFDGGLLKVRRDDVRLPGGAASVREYVVHPGAVVMLAFLDADTILLERQYRYPKRRHFIELPAGKLEPDEPPLATAKRELVEECGYEAARWWRIAKLDPCVGYSTEVIELWGAAELTHVGHRPDDGEHLESFPARLADALRWVREGVITDTKTALGLLWWAQWGRFPTS